jgi:NADH dehydrogenase [ubiquinone] 1 alpha subcomplex assembly factor 5
MIPEVFDRGLVRRRRNRAALQEPPLDYLLRHASALLVERLFDVRRRFTLALDIGCHPEELLACLGPAGRIDELIAMDLGEALIRQRRGLALVADEEALPLAERRLDLVLACATLHWVNDLPGALLQIRRILKSDGLFLAAIPGAGTLAELREVLLEAEVEETGGAGLRIAPFADVRDAGALLQRAGFALPVADVETVTVTFDHPLALLADLRAMGQANALGERRHAPLHRRVLARMSELYLQRFGTPSGRVPASFEFLMLSGWAPDPSQPKPQPRGSARLNLAREFAGDEPG